MKLVRKNGPLFEPKYFPDAKDPCIVRGKDSWHIFGSGGSTTNEEWHIIHATAPTLEGPWQEEVPVVLRGVTGTHVAAPSVIYDPVDQLFHMTVQQDFTSLGGAIEYLISSDGKIFTKMTHLLEPIKESPEAGLYDPHFSVIADKKYLVYSGIPAKMTYDRPFVPQPDIFLATSETNLWSGPWHRIAKILDHDHIDWHHNKREHPDYEWGIEGPQLVELPVGTPEGSVLLNATCFVTEGERGTRQRVFFAFASGPRGPYRSIGPVLASRDQLWESGENGHASSYIDDSKLYLFYQARPKPVSERARPRWRFGLAIFSLTEPTEITQ